MVRAFLIALGLVVSTAICGIGVLACGFVKLVTFGRARRRMILAASWFGDRWVQLNDAIFDAFLTTRWEISGVERIRPERHYLIISNHVSWVDIFAVARAFHGRTAFLRFFLKRGLIWFPIVGQACWALDFPFMRRYTPEYLKHHPEKRGLDLETTRVACRRYRSIPVAILNFIEGTRFTREKHEDQRSPYRHLLRPRVGGVGFVLASFAGDLDAVYDATIVYPHRDVTLWDLLTNRLAWINVSVRRIEVPAELESAAITEPGPAREHFKQWVEQIWAAKDEQISELLAERGVVRTTTPAIEARRVPEA